MLSVSATRVVPAPDDVIYAVLSDLHRHRDFSSDRLVLEAVDDDGDGGVVCVQGPFGLRWRARTTVTRRVENRALEGLARADSGTVVVISWRLHGDGMVELHAAILELAPADRLLLAVGGRRWLASAFEDVLERLAEVTS